MCFVADARCGASVGYTWLKYLYQAEALLIQIAGVSDSHCFKGQMRANKVTRGRDYDANATMALSESYQKQRTG